MANEKRLIDAERVRYELDIALMESYGKRRLGIADAIEVVNMMPTVDAVGVVHGRWEFSHTTTVEKFAVVKCSNCGHEAFAIANYVKDGHYCPNCGADMR